MKSTTGWRTPVELQPIPRARPTSSSRVQSVSSGRIGVVVPVEPYPMPQESISSVDDDSDGDFEVTDQRCGWVWVRMAACSHSPSARRG